MHRIYKFYGSVDEILAIERSMCYSHEETCIPFTFKTMMLGHNEFGLVCCRSFFFVRAAQSTQSTSDVAG